ncbi:MAG: flavin reductase [Clostridiales bacterium]|nr:flavin reductase [Clostridiales bacterium]
MIEKINVFDYSEHIMKALSKGILLNTNGEKFNSMVIGWGHLGVIWGQPTFAVYVREHRYTKPQLDKTREFTVSIPLGDPDAQINRVCGLESGRDIDKAEKARLTLVPARTVNTPAVKQYPLTLECRVLYSQKQDLALLPEDIRRRAYPSDVNWDAPLANQDAHTSYIGQIVDAYIIRDDEA